MARSVRVVWEQGLCRHGCGQPLANPRNQFINGHGSKLLDVLVDAYRSDSLVDIVDPATAASERVTPRMWAARSFTARGVAWFDWLVSHSPGQRPTKAQIDAVIAALPDRSVEEVLTNEHAPPVTAQQLETIAAHPELPPSMLEPVSGGSLDDVEGPVPDLATIREEVRRAEQLRAEAWVGKAGVRPDTEGLAADLAIVMEVVGKVVASEQAAQRRVAELEAEADEVERSAAEQIARVEAQSDAVAAWGEGQATLVADLRRELAEATRPITIAATDLGRVTDQEVLRLARERVLAVAAVLKTARYDGDAGEVVDLTSVFRGDFVAAPRVEAAVLFLGGVRR